MGLVGDCCTACKTDGTLCAGFLAKPIQGEGEGAAPGDKVECFLLDANMAFNATQCGKGSRVCTGVAVRQLPARAQPPKRAPPKRAKNVLFMVADDMRPSIGPYASPENKPYYSTPHLDTLARTGITFSRAYVQFSYCAPSRNSFMSGRRPDANKVYSFIGDFREFGLEWSSLPGHFVNNGYNVGGSGKLFHPNVPPNFDQPYSWTIPYVEPGDNATNLCEEVCCGMTDDASYEGAGHYCGFDLKEGTYLSDQVSTKLAIGNLETFAKDYKATGKPFFVGLGFHKPHLPWVFPKQFWAKIPADVPTAKHQAFPADVPPIAWHECAECSSVGQPWANGSNSIAYFNTKGEGRALPPQQWQSNMRRGYHASIAYVDDLIGQALQALEDLGLADDTIVSFTGDHGWNTGEHDVWCKMTNFENGVRVPLLFRAPWIKSAVGVVTPALSELVDMFPTLADLAGLGQPTGVGGAKMGGTSLVPVFRNTSASVKEVALSQFPRCWQNNTGYDGNFLDGPGDELNKTISLMSMSDWHANGR